CAGATAHCQGADTLDGTVLGWLRLVSVCPSSPICRAAPGPSAITALAQAAGLAGRPIRLAVCRQRPVPSHHEFPPGAAGKPTDHSDMFQHTAVCRILAGIICAPGAEARPRELSGAAVLAVARRTGGTGSSTCAGSHAHGAPSRA